MVSPRTSTVTIRKIGRRNDLVFTRATLLPIEADVEAPGIAERHVRDGRCARGARGDTERAGGRPTPGRIGGIVGLLESAAMGAERPVLGRRGEGEAGSEADAPLRSGVGDGGEIEVGGKLRRPRRLDAEGV